MNFFIGELAAKRLGLLRELIPTASRIAVLANPTDPIRTDTNVRDLEAGACGSFQVPHIGVGSDWIGRIGEHGDTRCCRDQLAQKSEPLCRQLSDEKIHTRGVAARPAKAGYKTESDGVIADAENNRNSRSRGLSGKRCGRVAWYSDHAHLTSNQIGRQLGQLIISAVGPTVFDGDILAVDVTDVTKSLPKRGHDV